MASPWTCTLAVRWSEPASRTVNGAQHWKPWTMRWRYLWRWGCSTAGSVGGKRVENGFCENFERNEKNGWNGCKFSGWKGLVWWSLELFCWKMMMGCCVCEGTLMKCKGSVLCEGRDGCDSSRCQKYLILSSHRRKRAWIDFSYKRTWDSDLLKPAWEANIIVCNTAIRFSAKI